jgi:hypothetical protein
MSTTERPTRHLLPSLTRIADLDEVPFEVEPLDRAHWATGQYVSVAIAGATARPYQIELRDGRRADMVQGDHIIGALGRRAATLQAVGDWADVGDDLHLDLLSMAGVTGRCTSKSAFSKPIAPLTYVGHVHRDGSPVTMRQFVPADPQGPVTVPCLLIVGTSMDAGKTLAGTRLVRRLRSLGMRIVAAKITGVGRYRDVLAFGDAGADWIFDFVDAGLPSTAVPADDFEAAVGPLLGRMSSLGADLAIVEAGASPLEPYNGDTAVRLLGESVRSLVLCASDPYAALGVMQAFDETPSFIAGRAAATTAGAELTARLTGRPCLNLLEDEALAEVDGLLRRELQLW